MTLLTLSLLACLAFKMSPEPILELFSEETMPTLLVLLLRYPRKKKKRKKDTMSPQNDFAFSIGLRRDLALRRNTLQDPEAVGEK